MGVTGGRNLIARVEGWQPNSPAGAVTTVYCCLCQPVLKSIIRATGSLRASSAATAARDLGLEAAPRVSSFPGGTAPYAAGGSLGFGLVPGRCALVATLRMMLMLMLVKGPVKPGKSGMAPQARADADRAQGMSLMPEFKS